MAQTWPAVLGCRWPNLLRSGVEYYVLPASTAWRVGERNPETRRRYILAETDPSPSSNAWHFNIVKNDQGLYNFQWCPNCLTGVCPKPLCGDAGIVVENERRLLVLDGPAFPFIFRRV
uniref:Kunitz-type protease inhibitor KPI-F9 n=1 Tax=Populus alba TaxID=43335 RepID=A0A4U5PQ81_POPAL|nr:Kunitz-type protease inhibitor KPI-F9 [Populus alba]